MNNKTNKDKEKFNTIHIKESVAERIRMIAKFEKKKIYEIVEMYMPDVFFQEINYDDINNNDIMKESVVNE